MSIPKSSKFARERFAGCVDPQNPGKRAVGVGESPRRSSPQPSIEREIRDTHAWFCKRTRQEGLSLRFDRHRLWYDFLRTYGFTREDLDVVISYLNQGIKDGKRNPGSLKLSNLIGQPDRFEEDLMEARRVMGGGARASRVPGAASPPDPPPPSGPEAEALRERNIKELGKVKARLRSAGRRDACAPQTKEEL